MISSLIAIAIVIALFLIYGLLRPSPGCMGGCHGCKGDHSCDLNTEEKNV